MLFTLPLTSDRDRLPTDESKHEQRKSGLEFAVMTEPPPLPPPSRPVTLLMGHGYRKPRRGCALFWRNQADQDLQRPQRGIVRGVVCPVIHACL